MAKRVGQVGAVGIVVARVDQRVEKPDNRICVVNDFCESGMIFNIDFLLTGFTCWRGAMMRSREDEMDKMHEGGHGESP